MLSILIIFFLSLHFLLVRSPQITSTLDDWRLRRNNNNSTTNSPSRNLPNKTNLNRRILHHQSNGSLHSADSQSSNSVSPAPSPLPRPATVHSTTALMQSAMLQSQTSATNLLTQSNSFSNQNSPTGLGKRWNSTGDFIAHSPIHIQTSASLQNNRFATKSLLNLQAKNSSSNLLKHG